MKIKLILILFAMIFVTVPVFAESDFKPIEKHLFNDKYLLKGYSKEYSSLSKETIIAMIKDDTLKSFQMAAAVRVFKEQFSREVFSKEKKMIEKILLRRYNRTNSPFVQVEIMHTLSRIDRYKYFKSMVPGLIIKLDHYNATINEMAYTALNDLIETGNNRSREARIIFNTIRKILFLTRKRLANVTDPDNRLKQKLKLLRWSIKILGSQELKKLPKEVINLL